MGGSRLGSLLAHGGESTAAAAVCAALSAGITMFDTADIYGQGSSELILGHTLPREGVAICTKAGFVTPLPLWMLRTAKPLLRLALGRRTDGSPGGQRIGQSGGQPGRLRTRFARLRGRSYPQRFDAAFLADRLDGSLRRLRREQVDIFLLHNPPPAAAARETLWRWVDRERAGGRIGAFGVSLAEGGNADRVWLEREQVSVVQLPARAILPIPGRFLDDPRASRLRVMAREILGPGAHDAAAIGAALAAVVADGRSSVAVLGMSTPEHVRSAATLFATAGAAR